MYDAKIILDLPSNIFDLGLETVNDGETKIFPFLRELHVVVSPVYDSALSFQKIASNIYASI